MHQTLASFCVFLQHSLPVHGILTVDTASLLVYLYLGQLIHHYFYDVPVIKTNRNSVTILCKRHNINKQTTLLLTSIPEQLKVDVDEFDAIDPSLINANEGSDISLFLCLSIRFLYTLYSSSTLLNPAHFIATFVTVCGTEWNSICAAALHNAPGSYANIFEHRIINCTQIVVQQELHI